MITEKPNHKECSKAEHGLGAGGLCGVDLPLLHRIAIVYLMLPLGVWLLGWFEWWVGVPFVALIALALSKALSGSRRVSVTPVALVLPSIALVWVLLNPAGGLFAGYSGDWPAHRTVLFELWRGSWPVRLMDWPSGEPPLLRYYLGYYMIPGLIGKWFGPAALNWAVPAWTWGGVALIVLLFARGLPTLKAALAATAVLVFFGGMKVANIFFHGFWTAMEIHWDALEGWWKGYHDLAIYQSLALTFYHTPQHFIGGGLITLLLIQNRFHPRLLAVSGIVISAGLFWSSMLSIGLLPLAGALIYRNGVRPLLTWPNLIVAPALAALLVLYLSSGAVPLHTSFIWQTYGSGADVRTLSNLLLVYLSEFGILALLLYWMDRRIVREPFFIAAVAILLAAPLFSLWDSEFEKRFVIPAQFVLAFWTACVAVGRRTADRTPASGGRDGKHNLPRVALALLICCLCIAGVSGLSIIVTNLSKPEIVAHENIGARMKDAPDWLLEQRTAAVVPGLLRILLRDNDGE